MSTRSLSVGIISLCLVAWPFSLWVTLVSAEPPAPLQGQVWEYKVVEDAGAPANVFQGLGASGWELAAAVAPDKTAFYVFKRPKR